MCLHYLLGKSRSEQQGYNVDWPEVSKEYKGIFINLTDKERKRLPDNEWIFSQPNIMFIWNIQGLDIIIEKVKNFRVICSGK